MRDKPTVPTHLRLTPSQHARALRLRSLSPFGEASIAGVLRGAIDRGFDLLEREHQGVSLRASSSEPPPRSAA